MRNDHSLEKEDKNNHDGKDVWKKKSRKTTNEMDRRDKNHQRR
jgi:hypothetical protein